MNVWCDAIKRHFSEDRLHIHVTGGETMLDKQNMRAFIFAINGWDFVETLRIDTNASWDWDIADKSKIHLMVSYHPSEIEDRAFFARLESLQLLGWHIEVVNYVVYADRVSDVKRMADAIAPLKLNVLPAFGRKEFFSADDVSELRKYISDKDWPNRFQEPTIGKECLFPGVAYEMHPSGEIHIGCHEELKGSIFDVMLPHRFDGYSLCPHQKCYCDDKYAFLKEVNDAPELPLQNLVSRIPLRLI